MFRAMKENGWMFPSLVLSLLGLLFLLGPPSAMGEMYKYRDKHGTLIFTDCYDCIPGEYRNQVEKIRDAAPARAEERPNETPRKREGEATEKPGQGNTPGAKTAEDLRREKETKEKQDAVVREKRARLEELRMRLAAVQQEKASLRTHWMVFDKIRLNQFNQEIEDLEKEIQALQAEIEEDRR
jgi:hypothetical protein